MAYRQRLSEGDGSNVDGMAQLRPNKRSDTTRGDTPGPHTAVGLATTGPPTGGLPDNHRDSNITPTACMSRQTSSTYIYRACVQPHTRALGERRSREKGDASAIPGFLGIGKPRRRVGVSLPANPVTWWSVSQARSHNTNLSSRGEAEDVFIPRACPRHIACLHLSCSLSSAPDDPPPPCLFPRPWASRWAQ